MARQKQAADKSGGPASMDALREFLADLMELFGADKEQYRWASERERLYELAFCLISTAGGEFISPESGREATDILASLGLLEIDVLATLPKSKGLPDRSNADVALLMAVLEHSGFDQEEANRATLVLLEAAQSITERFGGLIQRALRDPGMRMLEELTEGITIPSLGVDETRNALALWLQNVTSLPLMFPGKNSGIDAVCSQFNVTRDVLIEEADRAFVNVALLDDILEEYEAARGNT
jgi:hypothetical protein